MEAAPRLPMLSFELKASTEIVTFGPKLKQYIAAFYHEDPESYNTEIHNLESLRASATRPAIDVAGCQMLKKYYCQLNFLKSRFPMEKGQSSAISFSWKDNYAGLVCSVSDIDFELSSILYNIGALHTQLGATDSRTSSEGMKMSCTHFQCAAWAFQHLKENYSQLVSLSLAPEVVHFMYQMSLAQAQECILEKSMMDNRKSTIIAKVAVQVVDYYNQAIATLTSGSEEGSMGEIVGSRVFKDWNRHLKFKVAYNSCISLLYQGQQAEEQQKMGERVAYYQAASELLEEARKLAKGNFGQQQHEIDEALGFTQDVVEGKKKAAKNENEFIYHEVVPERDALQQMPGASLVKGIPFSVNDHDVSGPDLFQRLVPMEAHEASSVYSEQKAEMLRQIGAIVDSKDSELAEFMSSLQLDCLNQWRQAVGVPQDVVDRAAAICAKPQATQALVEAMGRLAGICHDVESLLGEIQEQIKGEEQKEQEYQKIIGSRPPSNVLTDLSRESGKYTEAHSKANESNQTLHRAMTMHMANLKILAQPIPELKKAIPSAITGDPNIDEAVIKDLEALVAKVDEMRIQRSTLVSQLREAVCADDITALLVTKPPEMTMDQLFQKELSKHKRQAALIEQNLAAQENILKALTDTYARFAGTRRHILELLKKRDVTVSALVASYDAYDDLLGKANKGIEFYQKLEGNVQKLQQRVKSACRVNEEERESILKKSAPSVPVTVASTGPKLKDYLASMRTATTENVTPWVPSVRPAPLGSEETNKVYDAQTYYPPTNYQYPPSYSDPHYNYNISDPSVHAVDKTQYKNPPAHTNYIPKVEQAYPATYPIQNVQANTSYYNTPKVENTPNYSQQIPSNTNQNYSASPQPLPQNQVQPVQNYTNQNYPLNYYGTQNVPVATQNYNTPSPTMQSIQNYSNSPSPTMQQQPIQNYSTAANYQTTPQSYSEAPTYPSPNYPTSYPAATYSLSSIPQSYSNPSVYSTHSDTIMQQPPPYTPYATDTNYQITSGYYTGVDTNTVPSQHQQNYQISSTYSTSVDSKAPISGYQGYPNEYQATNPGYQAASNQGEKDTPSTYSANYGYPINYHSTSQPPYQYQVPVVEYNYSPYYPTNTYPNQTIGVTSQELNLQYTNAGSNTTQQTDSGIAQQLNSSNTNLGTYYTNPYGYQTPGTNSMTMMHANTNIDTSSKQTNSVSAPSNVDLLAGLDFTVGQAPLQPQIQSSVTEMIKEVKKELVEEEPVLVQQEIKVELPETVSETKDPLLDPESIISFSAEIDKLEKFIDVLTVKTLNGPTPLDIKWKEIQEQQERDSLKSSISVARCYPMKNRFPDILPYDHTRVELPSTKDDYINASYIKNITPRCPPFIITQSPLKSTLDDFWTMIFEQQIEILVCLLSDSEMDEIYWPKERGYDVTVGKFKITLQSLNPRDFWIERVLSLTDGTKNLSIVHLQFSAWPGSGLFPTNVTSILALASAVLACHRQQRVKSRPVLIHCLSGVGRSGVLSTLIATCSDPIQMLDVSNAVIRMSQCRKNVMRDREHLKFTYEAVLQHAKDLINGKQLQTKMQSVSLAQEETQNLRSSSSADLSVDQSKQRKKFTPESFGAMKEQGIVPPPDTTDPLSALDPLWTIRK